jgi:hypothetical protein
LNQVQESQRLELAINAIDSDDPESQPQQQRPRRSQSAAVLTSSRSSGLLNRFSNSFRNKRQETELGSLDSPSIPGRHKQAYWLGSGGTY